MPNGMTYAILLLLYGQLTFVDITYTAKDHMVLGCGGGVLYRHAMALLGAITSC